MKHQWWFHQQNTGQWHDWQLHLPYNNVWWVVFNLKCKMRILFGPKKHFKIWRHICLKIELSHETKLSETIPKAMHMFCDNVLCQDGWMSSFRNTGQNYFMWSNTVNTVLQVLLIISIWNCAVTVQWKWQQWHKSPFRLLVDHFKENLSHSHIKRHIFSNDKRVALHRDGFPNHCWKKRCHHLIVWPVLPLYAPKHSLPNTPQWCTCSYVTVTTAQHTTNNETMLPWVLAYCSSVTCSLLLRVAKSHTVMSRHNMQT